MSPSSHMHRISHSPDMSTKANKQTVYFFSISLSIFIIISTWASWPAFALPTGGSSPSTGSRMKVLSVNETEKQHALEEAASLSLDLPASDQTRDQETPINQMNGSTSSLGYKQISLASLTLHQRDSPSNEIRTSENRWNESRPQEPWTELSLPRLKPSWLNVSSQFKITGSSIDEVKFLFPIEYTLRAAFDSPILLKTKLGILEGVRSIKFNKNLYTFLGIPYAKAPVGDLRFKAPEPVEKWDGILQATKWPPFCVQPSMTLASKSSPVHVLSYIMSEDCLYINIWTPSLKLSRNRKRPVMVWIHGGAFQYGGISVDENDGSALALLGDVVVVTLNYRISAFGFLNANNVKNAPNNVGLIDQQLAMEWVQANIKQFGGDPQQVTLFGESAGGHSVGLHMISPRSQPLFKRAILQSGVPTSFLRSYDANADNKGPVTAEGAASTMMAKRLKCYSEPTSFYDETSTTTDTSLPTSSAVNGSLIAENATADKETDESVDDSEEPILDDMTIECMRNKSSLEILKAMGAPGSSGFFPTGNDAKGVFPHGPIMDSFDSDSLKIGPQKDYLLGVNIDDGTFMLHYGLPSVFKGKELPKVSTIEELKTALKSELERVTRASAISLNRTELESASGSRNGGAQAHLYEPLMRTSTSMLESVMPKRVNETNGTANDSTKYNKYAEFGRNVGSLITDIIFLCPARSLARTLAESGRNAYFYLYAHRSSLSQYHEWLGVTHHDEVEFIFGRPLRMADVYTGKDIEMSQRMIKTWSHFAYTGQMADQLGVKWPKYGEEDNKYMTLSTEKAEIGERYHDRVCNIYDTIISVHLQGR